MRLALGLLVVGVSGALIASAASAPSASVQEAIKASNRTYFAYHDPLYWGRPVSVRITRVVVSHRDGRFAGARVEVTTPTGKPAVRAQRVLLEKGTGWHVRDVALLPDTFVCSSLPAGVVQEVVGACDAYGHVSDPELEVSGPLARRAPTTAERARIVAGARSSLNSGPLVATCLNFDVWVSRVDSRFADAEPNRATARAWMKNKACGRFAYNGQMLLKRLPGGRWRYYSGASEAFDCRLTPPGVIRSLYRECVINRRGR
jgi:hypothetical protein